MSETNKNSGTIDDLKIIASVRTGLVSADNALLRTLPNSYINKTLKESLTYLLQQENMGNEDLALAKSIRKEMRGSSYVVVVNGKNAELTGITENYLVRKEHALPNGEKKYFISLEIEVSAVEAGGLYR